MSLLVWCVPTAEALGRALRERLGLPGWVDRQDGRWVFVPDQVGGVTLSAGRRGDDGQALLLSGERAAALEEKYPGWLAGLDVQLNDGPGGSVWVESAQPALLADVRQRADEALG